MKVVRLGNLVRVLGPPALAVSLLVCSGDARGAGPKTSSLSWVRLPGAESCVATQSLARAVEERLGRSVFVSAADAEVSVEGRVEAVPKGFRATLFLRDARGSELGSRELVKDGASCDGLTDPLALVIAVMIDPDAALGPRPRPASAAPVASTSPPNERVVVRTETERVLVPVEAPPPPHLRADLGAGGRIAFGVVPGTGVGVSASALFVPAHFIGIEAHGAWLAPSTAMVSDARGSVDFSVAEVGLALCPIIVDERRLLFWVCATGDLGATFARPVGFDRTENEVSATVSLGLALRASLRLGGPFALRAGLSTAAPLQRPPFEVTASDGRSREVFRQAALTGAVDFGIGASFH